MAPTRTPICLEVQRTYHVTPHMIRVVLGGEGIVGYTHNEFTDAYVKLVLPPPGVEYDHPLDIERVRRERPQEEWPRLRTTYTVRGFDAVAGELWIDFVHHGDEGIAGPWAAGAQPGDRLHLLGPGGAYAPAPDADWHLFVGDEAALPAIAAAFRTVADGAPILAVIEVADAGETAYLQLPPRATVHWLLRDQGDPGLLNAVRGLDFPPGEVHAFVHGELATMRELRTHLLEERHLPPERLSLSGYWRRGKDEEGFQAEKAEKAEKAEGVRRAG